MSSEEKDTYFTLEQEGEEVLFKEKNSKFFGYTFPVQKEEDVKMYLEKLKKQHFSARHWCYAYQLGTSKIMYRANDDGEPNNSAGMPIYGQIQSFDVTNVLVVVVRYFGGVKLGVGGLISAYKETAKLALESSKIIEKTINSHFLITFEYVHLNKVMRIIKEKNLEIISQKMEMHCEIEVATRKKNVQQLLDTFQNLYELQIKALETL